MHRQPDGPDGMPQQQALHQLWVAVGQLASDYKKHWEIMNCNVFHRFLSERDEN
jgi:hypothetical protein